MRSEACRRDVPDGGSAADKFLPNQAHPAARMRVKPALKNLYYWLNSHVLLFAQKGHFGIESGIFENSLCWRSNG